MAIVSNWGEQLRVWWQGATPATRAMATGLVLLLVVGLGFAASIAASPDYQVIYRNVSGKDADAIKTVLTGKSIAMKYDQNAQTISVPAKEEGNATMAVEAAQILSKETQIDGLGDIDKITIGTTPPVERQRMLRQAQGELDQKLMLLDPVQSAAVSIAISPDSSFVGNETPPSASTILTLKPGETLSAQQTKGIVNLIAHAVPGLNTKDVTLTDQTGVSLWKDNGAGGSVTDGSLMAENEKFGEEARKKVQSILDQTVGRGKAVVTVNAELSQDMIIRHQIQHTPAVGLKNGMPITVHDKEETYSGAGAPPVGGVAGAAANLNAPSYQTSSGSAGGSGKYSNNDTVTTYAPDVTDTQTQVAPGDIRKLSVAALVDTSVSPEAVATLKDIISGAVGAFPGDNTRFITIHQITFDNSAQKAEATQMQSLASQALWTNISRVATVCIVAVVLLFLLTRSGRQTGQPRMALAGGGANIGSLESMPDAEMAAILDRASHSLSSRGLDEMMEERPLTVEDVLAEMPDAESRPRRRMRAPSIEEQQDLKMESIRTMVNAHPESVTLLLKGWMAEDLKVA